MAQEEREKQLEQINDQRGVEEAATTMRRAGKAAKLARRQEEARVALAKITLTKPATEASGGPTKLLPPDSISPTLYQTLPEEVYIDVFAVRVSYLPYLKRLVY